MSNNVVPRAVAAAAALLIAVSAAACARSAAGTPVAVVAVTGSSAPAVTSTVPPSSTAGSVPPSGTTSSAPSAAAPKAEECPLPATGFDCDFQRRFTRAEAYLAGRPGTTGIVVRDRQTGAVWRNGHAGDLTWTASTIKLAITVDLLLRDRAGTIVLTEQDRQQINAMLHSSDDNAADALWKRYAGDDHLAYNNAFPGYGMTSLRPQRGFTDYYPYWGFQKCTPDDLDRLINYVLSKLPGDLRAYIVGQLRTVAGNQQWGVWAAGPAARPGNKNGWSSEEGGWVMNSVGFAGPGERYTLSVMNNLRGKGGYDTGKATTTEVARIILAGRF